ncbi:MAG: MucR family transcriptional regulator [Rickettsiales bacterium]|jgi:predicted transcriptional regulator
MSQEATQQKAERGGILRMTAEVVSAYVGNNSLSATQLPEVINTVYGTLRKVNGAAKPLNGQPQKAAIPVRRSITPDYIVCLEDGKKLKMLKRHLRTVYGLSPDEYRNKWGLPADYPMVAPNYSKQRSAFAKKIGLGRSDAA